MIPIYLCRSSNIKGKFGSALRSKSHTGQVNEALCKVFAVTSACSYGRRPNLGWSPPFRRLSLLPLFVLLCLYSGT